MVVTKEFWKKARLPAARLPQFESSLSQNKERLNTNTKIFWFAWSQKLQNDMHKDDFSEGKLSGRWTWPTTAVSKQRAPHLANVWFAFCKVFCSCLLARVAKQNLFSTLMSIQPQTGALRTITWCFLQGLFGESAIFGAAESTSELQERAQVNISRVRRFLLRQTEAEPDALPVQSAGTRTS